MDKHEGDPNQAPAITTEQQAPAQAMTEALGAADAAPNLAQSAGLTELNALLGHGTSYEGQLFFEGRCRIEGALKGSVRGEGLLVIGLGAVVEADIEVDACLIVGGQVQGQIRARQAIELHLPAEVKGDLHAPNIFIDRGVKFEGNCRIAPLAPETDSETPAAEPQGPTEGAPEQAPAPSHSPSEPAISEEPPAA